MVPEIRALPADGVESLGLRRLMPSFSEKYQALLGMVEGFPTLALALKMHG
jgi:hypothetical protein